MNLTQLLAVAGVSIGFAIVGAVPSLTNLAPAPKMFSGQTIKISTAEYAIWTSVQRKWKTLSGMFLI